MFFFAPSLAQVRPIFKRSTTVVVGVRLHSTNHMQNQFELLFYKIYPFTK